jgi:DNA-binding phage protein
MTTASVSANVAAEVRRSGRTAADVAMKVGLSRAQWDRRMSGEVEWRIDELRAVARELGVTVTVLIIVDEVTG